MAVKFLREMIGEPCGTRVAPSRVTGPPRDAHIAFKFGLVCPKHPCNLEHGGVAGGVVAYADVPAIVMAMEQHKIFRCVCAGNFGDWDGLIEPTFLHHGANRCVLARPSIFDQRRADVFVHCYDRNFGLA